MASGEMVSLLIERISRLQRAADHAQGLNPAQWEVLRYLSRANRYSNTATAVTSYLGSTKGTVSQTLNALERKGLVSRTRDEASARIVRLGITAKGEEALGADPMGDLRAAIDAVPSYRMRPVEEGLKQVLDNLRAATSVDSVSACDGCKHFKRTRFGAETPYMCALFGEGLEKEEAEKLCAFHEPE